MEIKPNEAFCPICQSTVLKKNLIRHNTESKKHLRLLKEAKPVKKGKGGRPTKAEREKKRIADLLAEGKDPNGIPYIDLEINEMRFKKLIDKNKIKIINLPEVIRLEITQLIHNLKKYKFENSTKRADYKQLFDNVICEGIETWIETLPPSEKKGVCKYCTESFEAKHLNRKFCPEKDGKLNWCRNKYAAANVKIPMKNITLPEKGEIEKVLNNAKINNSAMQFEYQEKLKAQGMNIQDLSSNTQDSIRILLEDVENIKDPVHINRIKWRRKMDEQICADIILKQYGKKISIPSSSAKAAEQLHPDHYKAGKLDVIDFCHHHDVNFCRGNIIKYVTRAGKKKSDNPLKEIEDLKKAKVYLDREIKKLEETEANNSKV